MDSDGGRPHSLSMSVAAFDTLKLARTLRDQAKFTPEQAEGLATALSGAFHEDIATKADLRELELRLSAKIDAGRAEAKADLQEAKADLQKEMGSLKSEIGSVAGSVRLEIGSVRNEIQAVKSEMLRWIIPLLLAQMAVMIGVLIRAL